MNLGTPSQGRKESCIVLDSSSPSVHRTHRIEPSIAEWYWQMQYQRQHCVISCQILLYIKRFVSVQIGISGLGITTCMHVGPDTCLSVNFGDQGFHMHDENLRSQS